MKKVMLCTAFSLLIVPMSAFASSDESKVYEVDNTIYDLKRAPEKSFSPPRIDGESDNQVQASAPYWSASSSYTFSLGAVSKSDSYTSSTKKTRKQIDYIYAKTKAYVNGVFKGSSSDTQKKSSRAGASFFAKKNFTAKGEAVGSHEFRHSGYKTWIVETEGT
ncbi:hypothetical protein ABES08_03355 [Peribacillus simplex]|uniref:XoxI protein n=1 Tax=Peribacillus simplex TaxID=1478 RepID=A0AAW7ITN0_9BACI|nr:hypothetical protein [Peribacillus simplex]AMM91856.1 hypothetical protein UP17_04205 [Peribacillus simplex]MDM5455186.1 hypothetical protein [Peribacillus simplex]